MLTWNPWHGCHPRSEGCEHCYMFQLDRRRGVDTSVVRRTGDLDLPLRRRADGSPRVPPGAEVQVGLSTDFFVEEADAWRPLAWRAMRLRPDVAFRLLTKRAERMASCLPPDWGAGYDNVMVSVTAENQRRADERLPLLLALPARHRGVMAAPLIGPVDMARHLDTGLIDEVTCDGERYAGARPCRCEWVESLSAQCGERGVPFTFFATGEVFVRDGRTYRIPDKATQRLQAARSGLSRAGRPVVFRLRPAQATLFDGPEPRPE